MRERIVSFDYWNKLDLRVGQIVNVEDVEGADKLYKLTVEIGEKGKRFVCAGLKEFYSKDELQDKKVILFVNLKTRMMKGIESQGMILAADDEKGNIVLISPEKNIELGSRIR